jgi:hypothetical protein
MNSEELTLNIAVNMGRLSRFSMEGKKQRIGQFLDDTEKYLLELEQSTKKERFLPTFLAFKDQFSMLKQDIRCDDIWAETALTWANILAHRAKLS